MLKAWKKGTLPVALLMSCFWPSAGLAQAGNQQNLDVWKRSTDPLEKWIYINGQKLAQFVPDPVPGLIGHLPWEAVNNYLPHFESYVHHQYLGFSVERMWGYDDPSLFQQVNQAQQARDEAHQALEAPENVRKIEAWMETRNAVAAQYMGPKGFRNPPAGTEPQKMRMKCFLVEAQIPPGERYEGLARQMLEKVDYEGLAKLIEP